MYVSDQCQAQVKQPLTQTGSRRLITYRRIPDAEVSKDALDEYANRDIICEDGTTANELNPFRRGYFRKFQSDS